MRQKHRLIKHILCAMTIALGGFSLNQTIAAEPEGNFQLRAVPAKTPITIDGKLDDWDLSGQIFSCYDPAIMRDTHSSFTAAAYDETGLYLSFHIKDRSPLVNHEDPANAPGKGWRNDCIQLRIWTDQDKPYGPGGAQLTHIDAFFYTDKKQPVAYLQHNNFADRGKGFEDNIDNAVGSGIDLAFTKDADGKGYVQEMRISWNLIRRSDKPLESGQSLRMGIEYMWGSDSKPGWPGHRYADLVNIDHPQREFFWSSKESWGEVKLMPSGNLTQSDSITALETLAQKLRKKYETHGVVPIEYNLPTDQNVTLVIETPNGKRVRNLISDYPRETGKNVDYWDGKDDDGNVVPAGQYQVRGLHHGALDLLYQLQYGTPGTPPWVTANGKGDWLSDHARPIGVASDGTWVYLSHHMSEGGSTVIGLDETGQKRWGIGRISGGPLAVIGGDLYMISGGGHPVSWGAIDGEIHLQKIDARAGKFTNFTTGKSDALIYQFDKDRKLPPNKFTGEIVEEKSFTPAWFKRETLGLTAAGGKLYASLLFDNLILQIDPASATVEKKLPLENPVGLAGDKSGNLYAVSGRTVVRMNQDGTFTTVISSGLSSPMALACDTEDNIYVSDWLDQQCVKVFTVDGKLLRTIGKTGGRPLIGPYDPSGMFLPAGLALTGNGNLWVAEFDYQPKRYSVWNKAGELVNEYDGPTWYGATECNVDTTDPTKAYCMGDIVDLDWKKGLWRVSSTLWRPMYGNAFFGPIGEHGVIDTYIVNGKKYIAFSRSSAYFCLALIENGQARPLMARGNFQDLLGGTNNGIQNLPESMARFIITDPQELEQAKKKYPDLFDGTISHPAREFHKMIQDAERQNKFYNTQFVWTDANGDGRVDDPEMVAFHPAQTNGPAFMGYWRTANDAQFTQYLSAMENKDGKMTFKLWKWPISGWNECGAPVYRPDDAKVILERPIAGAWSPVPWADEDGTSIHNVSPLLCVDKDGNELWNYPNRYSGVHGSHAAPKDMNGILIGTLKVIGSADMKGTTGKLVCFNGNMGKAMIMTMDGLYVSGLLRDNRSAPDAFPEDPKRGISLMQTTAGGEWFGGEFFKNKLDGKIYLGFSGRNCQLLNEVTGLETITRIAQQTIAFTEESRQTAIALINAQDSTETEAHQLAVAPIKATLGDAPAAALFDWKNSASWNYDEDHHAEAALGFDNDNLYVCFRNVIDNSPMINNGKLAERLFKTGDAAIVELRVKPDDQSNQVIAGDMRLLFSVFENKPVAVLYRYKALESETHNPVEFSSPVMTVRFEVMKIITDSAIAIDRIGGKYALRAAVPLKALGWNPQSGKNYKADLGIIYSDPNGQTNQLRMNWANKNTGLVSDLPAESQLHPELWGTLTVKENK